MFDLNAWAEPRRELLQQRLDGLFADAWPAPFAPMCLHPLQTGGKRMRPLLTLAAYEAVGGQDTERALPAALAIELVHTYSLVHDDMPCMDDDSERRGKPTTHVLYGEDMALLVGDALLTEAFRRIADAALPAELAVAQLRELSSAAGYLGMVGGQASDLGAEGPVTDIETLTRLHRGKTGALIRCAVRMGALAGGAKPMQLQALTRFAEAVGLAFQLADDILDADEDKGEDGPPSFVKLLGVDETRRRARELADQARASLEAVPNADALEALALYTVERDL
ncbi:MAG: polyprenyl synthetase family protein [Myxococcota bacterium]|nr:polyprenyl synthetase family protein [Myxococcota bacterium]